jgi:hypothetical protein
VIIFVPLSADEGKPWDEWILRRCPECGERSIEGHGRRSKQAHDEQHDWIRIRRGRCRACHRTFTFLPVWSLPYTHYSLWCRAQAQRLRRLCRDLSSSVPPVRDPNRTPDESTVARWIRGVRVKALAWLRTYQNCFNRAPTILAWDARRLWRNLIAVEGRNHAPPVTG